jgi:hypothetical protein
MVAPLIIFAVLTGIVGIVAPIMNRGRKKAACILSLLAGAAPVAFFLSYEGMIHELLIYFGLFGAPPLFLISFFAFGFGEKKSIDQSAALASLLGIFVSLVYTFILFHVLSRME